MYFNDYNKEKSSTVLAGYDVGVTNMDKFHLVLMKSLLTNEIKDSITCAIKFNYIEMITKIVHDIYTRLFQKSSCSFLERRQT